MSERVTVSIYDGDTLLADNITALVLHREPTTDMLGKWCGTAVMTGAQARSVCNVHQCRILTTDGRQGWISVVHGNKSSDGTWAVAFEGTGSKPEPFAVAIPDQDSATGYKWVPPIVV